MGRIEEIKKVVKNSPQDFEILVPAFKSQIFIEYLLSRLQIAEETLKWYANERRYADSTSDDTLELTRKDRGTKAREALEQIRRD